MISWIKLPGFKAIDRPQQPIGNLLDICKDDDEDEEDEEKGATKKSVTKLDIEKYFNYYDILILDKSNYPRPNIFFDLDEEEIDKVLADVNDKM